jgi:hypothetical protein
MAKNSAIGPSTRAGKNVSAPTTRMVPSQNAPNFKVSVRRVRRPAAHVCSECSGAADLAAQWVNQPAPPPATCASAPGARADRG